MRIVFRGSQTIEEAAEGLLSILKLFKERYGIENFTNMNLELSLLDHQGHDVELIDSATSEVYGAFEVYKSDADDEASSITLEPENTVDNSFLKLVVDNTTK